MKLLVLDVEGTLFQTKVKLPGTSIDSTVWQSIARELGQGAELEESATHQRWDSGGYANYLAWMEDTIRIHRKYGLTETQFRRVIKAAEYNPGVAETLPQIDRSKYEILLISGGFRELAARPQLDFRVKHAFAGCEYLFDLEGNLASWNLLPCDFSGKLYFVEVMLREYGLGRQDWMFVGDGRNDVPLAQRAPVAIGYRPHPDLERVCTGAIDNFSDLLRWLD